MFLTGGFVAFHAVFKRNLGRKICEVPRELWDLPLKQLNLKGNRLSVLPTLELEQKEGFLIFGT